MIIKIEKSPAKNKKYRAHVKQNDKIEKIDFGDSRYEQYKDSTPLKAFSHLDHGDKKRRDNYFKRHSGTTNKKEALKKEKGITARYLSHKFLW